MKRVFLMLLAVSALLCGCAGKRLSVNTDHTAINDGIVFSIDTENQTITDGKDVYRYSVEKNSITIIYPNNATYSWFSAGYGSSSGDYDDRRYISGMILAQALSQAGPKKSGTDPNLVLFGLVCTAIGLWQSISPDSVWYLRHGWKFRNAEPSDIALGLTRLGGGLAIIIGVIAFLSGL